MEMGRAIVQARTVAGFLTAEAKLRAQRSVCGFCYGRIGTKQFLSQFLRFPRHYDSTAIPYSLVYHEGTGKLTAVGPYSLAPSQQQTDGDKWPA